MYLKIQKWGRGDVKTMCEHPYIYMIFFKLQCNKLLFCTAFCSALQFMHYITKVKTRKRTPRP